MHSFVHFLVGIAFWALTSIRFSFQGRRNLPCGDQSVVSSDAWSISEPPSTVSSRRQTMIPSRSHGPQTQTKSSPLSDEGTKC